jgi:hypothetical protein
MASATWIGSLNRTKSVVTTERGTLWQRQYFACDYTKGKGSDSYKPIAAAHAACLQWRSLIDSPARGLTRWLLVGASARIKN